MDYENQLDSDNQQVFSEDHQVGGENSDAVEKEKKRSSDRQCPV